MKIYLENRKNKICFNDFNIKILKKTDISGLLKGKYKNIFNLSIMYFYV